MKIILTPAEAKEFKQVAKTLGESSKAINDSLGIPTGEEMSMSDFFTGSKYANVQVGFQGVTINIDPAFVSDFCNIYMDTITVVSSHVVSLVDSLMKLNLVSTLAMSKWN